MFSLVVWCWWWWLISILTNACEINETGTSNHTNCVISSINNISESCRLIKLPLCDNVPHLKVMAEVACHSKSSFPPVSNKFFCECQHMGSLVLSLQQRYPSSATFCYPHIYTVGIAHCFIDRLPCTYTKPKPYLRDPLRRQRKKN